LRVEVGSPAAAAKWTAWKSSTCRAESYSGIRRELRLALDIVGRFVEPGNGCPCLRSGVGREICEVEVAGRRRRRRGHRRQTRVQKLYGVEKFDGDGWGANKEMKK
jgi:hypothetical protein